MHIYTHIYVHTHTCAHTCMHVCTCVYTCTFVYTHDVLFLGSRETVKFAQLRSCDLRPGRGVVGRKRRKGGTWGLPESRSQSCLEPFCLLPSSRL